MPTLVKTRMSIMLPLALSDVRYESAAMTTRIILNGLIKAVHHSFHQLEKLWSIGMFFPDSLSLLSASLKLKPA